MGNYWDIAKMQNFFLHVNRWNGTTKHADFFRNNPFSYTSNDLQHSVDDIRHVEILLIAANGGQLPVTSDFSEKARNIALTIPRNQWKKAAARSVGSTSLNTPRDRGFLASSSSSVGATPLNTPRDRGFLASSSSSVGSTPLNSPHGHLCIAPPPQKSLIIEWFMARQGPSFNAEMEEVCKGLTYSNLLLVQIFDIVRLHQMFFREMTLNSPVTQMLFLEKLSNCALIQMTLQASHLFKSIKDVAFADKPIQSMFIQGLIFSFFQACRKPFTLGIYKIVPNQDGDGFSIELFQDYMIQDYLNRFRPSTNGEQASMA